jgi:hypothetical protein
VKPVVEEEANEVVEVFSMSRKGMRGEITGRLLRGGRIEFDPDNFSRLMAEQAKPQRYSRLGPANPAAKLLSPQQVADELGIGRDVVDDMVDDGTLRAVLYRSGPRKKLWGIPRKELDTSSLRRG